jgi:hypothetical protein
LIIVANIKNFIYVYHVENDVNKKIIYVN